MTDLSPEDHAAIDPDLRARIKRARAKVDASLNGPPELHSAHLQSLTKGLQLVQRRLAPREKYRPPRVVGVCARCCNPVHQGVFVQLGDKVYHDKCNLRSRRNAAVAEQVPPVISEKEREEYIAGLAAQFDAREPDPIPF